MQGIVGGANISLHVLKEWSGLSTGSKQNQQNDHTDVMNAVLSALTDFHSHRKKNCCKCTITTVCTRSLIFHLHSKVTRQ